MILKNKLKFYAIGVVIVFLTLVMVPTSAVGHIGSDGEPSLTNRLARVYIASLTVYEFEDPFFEIETLIANAEKYPVFFRLNCTLIFPNGNVEQPFWYEGTIGRFGMIGFNIFCMYTDNQFGTYTWVETIRDSNGNVLDQEKVSWVREPILG